MEAAYLTLVTQEGHEVSVDSRLQSFSSLLQHLIADSSPQSAIYLPSLSSAVLYKIVEYYEHHHYTTPPPIKKPLPSDRIEEAVTDPWDAPFINGISEELLVDVVMACYDLGLYGLFDLCSGKIASMFKGKTIDELRQKYGITEEFTAEEEERLKKEYPWALEGNEDRLLQARHTP